MRHYEQADNRIVARLELTPSAKAALEQCSARSGMTQFAASSRLIEWFTNQSDEIRLGILGGMLTDVDPNVQHQKIIKALIARQVPQKKI